MILLELDPNIVKPGWTPLLITIGLAAIMYLLFRSMRRQFRRVDTHFGITGQRQVPVREDARAGSRVDPPADPAAGGRVADLGLLDASSPDDRRPPA